MLLKKFGKLVLTGVMSAALVVTAACGGGDNKQGSAEIPKSSVTKEVTLTGAGASFPNPLFQEMFYAYYEANPNIKVNYNSTGSGAGIRQLTEGTVDFGASDAFMSDEAMKDVARGVIHVPITIGAVAMIYNVQGVEKGLKLTQETLADIYLGKITRWNDARLKADNPNVNLPDAAITVVHRSDGSGTTSIFTDYLSAVSAEWKTRVGMGTSVQWPVGIGAPRNDGVAAQVAQTPNSIGYVEYAYATINNLTYAQLRNKNGKFVFPSQKSASMAAAEASKNMPADTRTSFVEQPGDETYGIVGISWLLMYASGYQDADAKQALIELVQWLYRGGQVYADDLHYARIPEELAKLNDTNLAKIK